MRVLSLPRTVKIGALIVLAAATAAPLAAQREPGGRRGWLGFSFGSTVELRDVGPAPMAYATTDTALSVVNYVLKGSPADRAGMEPGDTLLQVNGERATLRHVQDAARRLHPGDTVRIQVRRDGRAQLLTLHAAERPAYLAYEGMPEPFLYSPRAFSMAGDSIRRFMRVFMDSARMQMDTLHLPRFHFEQHDSVMIVQRPNGKPDTVRVHYEGFPGYMRIQGARDSAMRGLNDQLLMLRRDGMPGFDIELTGRRAIAGAAVQELNEQLARYFGVREGLLVERVTTGTPAARAGLEAGDVVTAADGRPVGDIADLRRALRGREGTVRLDIVRKGKTQSVSIKWP